MAVLQYNTKVDGQHIDCRDVSMSIDWESYCWSASISLNNLESWLLCVPGSTLEVKIDVNTYVFLIDSRDRSQTYNSWDFTITARSPTSVLGEGSVPIYKTWDAALTKAIAFELAGDITFSYEILNWQLPDGTLEADGEFAIAILKRIAEAAGGLLYTDVAGDLFMVPKYTTPPPLFDIGNVYLVISSYDDILELSETKYPQPGYNKVEVSSEPLSESAAIAFELVEVAGLRAIVTASILPFKESLEIKHSGHSLTAITGDPANPILEEKEERVEFVDGVGNVEHLIKNIKSVVWDYINLGSLTEDGNSLTSDVKANSLATVRYDTEYHKFEITVPAEGELQIYTEGDE